MTEAKFGLVTAPPIAAFGDAVLSTVATIAVAFSVAITLLLFTTP